jgi:hypothetical protein
MASAISTILLEIGTINWSKPMEQMKEESLRSADEDEDDDDGDGDGDGGEMDGWRDACQEMKESAMVGDGRLFIFVSHRLLNLPVGRSGG